MGIHHLHEALAQGTSTPDEAHGRVYGWLPGVVTDIDTSDPKLTQIKARLGKQGDNESTDWISQVGMGGMESLPEVGDPVGVFFSDGDVHRGAYFCFPQSNTKGRPTEPMMLGKSAAAMLNAHASQLNKVVADLAALSTLLGTTGLGVSGTKATGTFTPTATGNMGNAKASDGSVVAPSTADAVVLSKRARIR